MADLIIRTPYAFHDERLFPPGWRSFSNLCYSINHINLEKEISCVLGISGPLYNELQSANTIIGSDPNNEYFCINDLTGFLIDIVSKNIFEISSEISGINKIEGPKTNEIIMVNDLRGIIRDIIARITLEISEEILVINAIESPFTKEMVSINYLSEEKIKTIIAHNDINEKPLYNNEISSTNRLDSDINFSEISNTIYIYIDGTLVNDHVERWTIEIDESAYVNSATIYFAGKTMFPLCNPTTNIGERRIKIQIDGIDYNFMLEKRSPSRTPDDDSFSIWGRSHLATLDLPYATPIIDREVVYNPDTEQYYSPDDISYVPHIWQTSNTTAKTIIKSLIGDIVLDFQISDFIVKQGTLNVSHSSPISIINSLVKTVGAKIRTDLNDKLIIRYENFNTTGNYVASFTDLEDIFLLSESISYPGGFNRILIKGYEDPIAESSTNLNMELDKDLNGENKTEFNFGDQIYIRLYKAPFTTSYNISCSIGDLSLISSNKTQTITDESSGFSGKTLTTNYPIESVTSIMRYNCQQLTSSDYSYSVGYNIVNSESAIQDEPVLISYTSKYDLYRLTVNIPCSPMPFSQVLSQITAKQT